MLHFDGKRAFFLLALTLLLSACAASRLPANLGAALQDNNDIELVGEALPAYLVMMDAVVKTWPKDGKKIAQTARLYSAYAGMYVDDDERAGQLAQKALDYALRAACLENKALCDADTKPLPEFERALATTGQGDVATLFDLGSVWAGWVQQHLGDWNAVAQLPRVQQLIERVIALDSGYDQGQAHMYLGVLNGFLPAALGGHPEVAKAEFQQAITLSDGNNLLAKVFYAKYYARMTGKDALLRRLLDEVLVADPGVAGFTLQNVYAQRLAKGLQDDLDDE